MIAQLINLILVMIVTIYSLHMFYFYLGPVESHDIRVQQRHTTSLHIVFDRFNYYISLVFHPSLEIKLGLNFTFKFSN
jgi:hypothetical protein